MDNGYMPPPPPPAPPTMGWSDPPPPPPPAAPQLPPAHRSPAFWLMVTGAVVVLLSASGAGIAALVQHTATPANDTGTARTTAPTAPAASSADDAQWVHTVATDGTGLGSDFIALANDATAENEAAVSADCQTVLNDITSFQTDITPIPPDYAGAGATLVRALQTYTDACNNFISGIADQSVSEINAASSEIITGNGLLNEATADIATEGAPQS
jgi:hypothetical protein